MTREEIKKAIKNGESVWGCLLECLLEICNDNTVKIDENIVGSTEINEYGFNFIDLFNNSFYLSFKDVYKTKAEAEHYSHHANITRTEQLPFLTWEEFKGGKEVIFKGRTGKGYALFYNKGLAKIELFNTDGIMWGIIEAWDLTEANFYKAYDECVRLFREEE